jgi:hypothetical protein
MQTNSFQNSVVKELIRQLLVNKVVDHFGIRRKISCYTLPGDSLSFETQLYSQYKSNLTLEGVERKKAVYERAKRMITQRELPMTLHRAEDRDFWEGTTDSQFDMLWLDYCAGWNEFQEKTLEEILSENRLKFTNGNPLLAITISHGYGFDKIENIKSEVYDLLTSARERDHNDKAYLVGIPRRFNKLARQYGLTFVPQTVLRYRDSTRAKHAIPMFLFVFEVFQGKVKFNDTKIAAMDLSAGYSSTLKLH